MGEKKYERRGIAWRKFVTRADKARMAKTYRAEHAFDKEELDDLCRIFDVTATVKIMKDLGYF